MTAALVDQAAVEQLRRRCINVADARLGATALFATDDFFAPKERMLQASEPEWRAGVYDAHGKWMDGWESRRRRDAGHDYCIVRLAAPSTLTLLEIDTRYFTGNFPPHASVQGCHSAADPEDSTRWTELLPRSALSGNQRQYFRVQHTGSWTHLKLSIYPDGGVARFRAYGTIQFDWRAAAGRNAPGSEPPDLVAALHGGVALACSDEHYGAMDNLLLPGRGTSMADGWETRRRREPGHDWVILRLGHRGHVRQVEIDTAYFKGNYPHQVSILGSLLPSDDSVDWASESLDWPQLLAPQYLHADSVHRFAAELSDLGPLSHVRVNIHPDGGLSRVRLFGLPDFG